MTQFENEPQHSGRIGIPSWLTTATLVLLALASSLAGIRNKWVQDDLPIITVSKVLHSLARPWAFFTQPWWPDPYPKELYRPLTSTLLALQWAISGGGQPLVFRICSNLLYVVATLAVFYLAKRIVSPTAAWLAAALFAVHPVHVEAVAVAVNQAELVVTTLAAVLCVAYLKQRRSGAPVTASWIAAMAAGYAAASLFKESGLMIPAIFVAAELTLITSSRPARERIRELRPLFLTLALVAVWVVWMRNLALAGNTKGTFTAEGLAGLGIGGRALTMLGVVPTWARLLVWPDHLQADYSPKEIVAATAWGASQTLGLLLLGGVIAGAWLVRRRQPVVTFAICWLVIALFPVSNVLVATGIVVAERTLFLASVAVVLIGGVILAPLVDRAMALGSVARIATATAVVLVLGMGLTRSASRQLVWYDLATLWHQTLIDAPNSYRAHHAYAQILFKADMKREAEYHYRRAMELYPPAWPVYLDLADKYRLAGKCTPAIRLYRALLPMSPDNAGARGSLIACLVYEGNYLEAVREARIGLSFGKQVRSFELYGRIADSAAKVAAPPRTVVLPPPPDSIKTP